MQKYGHQIVKNEMFIFGLHSTSDDRPSDLSDKSHPKCKQMATKLSKNEMFIFEKMAAKSSKNEMQFMHLPPPDEMGMGQERYGSRLGMGQVWAGNGLGMGQVWDGTIQMDFMQMAYYPADSCAISPSAFLLVFICMFIS